MFKKRHSVYYNRKPKVIAIMRRCPECKEFRRASAKETGNICPRCFYELYQKKFQTEHPQIQRERVAISDALHRPMKYGAWLAWVEKNKERRRKIARDSWRRRYGYPFDAPIKQTFSHRRAIKRAKKVLI